jgi:type II secretory ATPase GspE/PulE/Tfp pilus assembly ATPase PilB-like protein
MDSSDLTRFSYIGKLSYKVQAVFFLNGTWSEHQKDAEKVWQYYQQIVKLDAKKEDGCDLDEFYAHKFLENVSEPMTAIELREVLKKIDLNEDHHMSFIEFLVYKFKVDVRSLLSRPQEHNNDNETFKIKLAHIVDDIEKAKQGLDAVKKEMKKLEAEKKDLEDKAKQDGVKGGLAKTLLNEFLSKDHSEFHIAVLHAEAAVRKAKKAFEDEASKLKNEYFTQGNIWWMERELEEIKKYKPKQNMAMY